MKEALIVFVAQYVYVVLLGLQSLNVNYGHRVAAGVTSGILGAIGFQLTGTIAAAAGTTGSLIWFAFVLAGPLGIVTSMELHRRFRGVKK